jgi:glycosyltransferase involved in cell wall biosynthesis
MSEARKLRVVVLAPNPRDPGGVTRAVDGWRDAGIERWVEMDVIEVAAWDSPRIVQTAQAARAYVRLARCLRDPERRPDIVHLNVSTGPGFYREYISSLIVRLFGVPLVVQLHSGGFGRWIYGSLARMLVSYSLFSKATVTIVVAHRSVPLVGGLGARRITVVPPLLPPQLERSLSELAAEKSRARAAPSERTRLLFYGRWAPIKGLDVLADALATLDVDRQRRITLAIFGNGDRRWLGECFSKVRHAQVRIGGWLDDARKCDELRTADAFVLASRHEAFPQSLLEVIAARVPLIASDTGGVAEAVGDYPPAVLVPVEDVASLRVAIERLVDGVWPGELLDDPPRGIPEAHSAPVILAGLMTAYRHAVDCK